MAEPINGRWLYGRLRMCPYMEIVSKVYNDWIRTNSGLCGFLCKVKGKGTKEELMEKVKEHVQKHELPIIVDDIPGLATTFKLVIIK